MSSVGTAVPPLPAAAAVAGDFPTWLPAMLVKELRQGLRTRGFVVVFIAFQALMALVMMGAVVGSDAMAPGARTGTTSVINVFFWTVLFVQLLVVTPSRALGSLQLEMESRAIDLLMLTRLSAWRIVLGKWASLVAQSALLLVAMLPYGVVRYFAGSVDLVSDAKMCLGLLACSSLLTAAGLWGSGLAKVARIGFVIGGVFVAQLWRPLMASAGVSGLGPAVSFNGVEIAIGCLDGALLLGFFLIAAVRRIAPPAENHALTARALPLAALIAVPVAAQFTTTSSANVQLIFAGGFALIVCAVEFGSARLPMAVHVRPWASRGPLGAFLGRFVLPGWPSAFLFAVVITGIAALAVQIPGVAPANVQSRIAWLAALALGGLAFPVLALVFFKQTAARSAASLYGLTLGAMSVLAATSAVMASAFPLKYAKLVLLVRVVPVSGFWLSLGDANLSAKAMVIQAVLITAVLITAWWKAGDYWRHVAQLEAREGRAKP